MYIYIFEKNYLRKIEHFIKVIKCKYLTNTKTFMYIQNVETLNTVENVMMQLTAIILMLFRFLFYHYLLRILRYIFKGSFISKIYRIL